MWEILSPEKCEKIDMRWELNYVSQYMIDPKVFDKTLTTKKDKIKNKQTNKWMRVK